MLLIKISSLISTIFPLVLRINALIIFGLGLFYIAVKYVQQRNRVTLFNVNQVPQILSGLICVYVFDHVVLSVMNYSRIAHLIAALSLPIFVFNPFNIWGLNTRRAFLSHLKSITTPTFNSILLADIATSYSKVLADWDIIFFCYILKTSKGMECGAGLLSAMITCLPYAIRFLHCVKDFKRTSGDWRYAVNAFKYLLSFPLVYLTFLSSPGGSIMNVVIGVNFVINCLWDILMDWNSTFNSPYYAFAIPMNIAIRFLWALRLNHVLNFKYQAFWNTNAIVLTVQAVEIGRRMMWCVGRMEKELSKGGQFSLVEK